jgi:hypothetical protein
VLILGALGGSLVALLPSHHRPGLSAVGSTTSTTRPHVVTRPSRKTPAEERGAAPAPPVGALSLQLRPRLGSASCSRVVRHLESVSGVLVAANPPATAATVMDLPTSTRKAPACVNLGAAFAIAWSGDITGISTKPLGPAAGTTTSTPTGPLVEVVIDLAPDAVTNVNHLALAESPRATTDVVAQGIDLGKVFVSKGAVITLQVTQSVATFLSTQLAHGHS